MIDQLLGPYLLFTLGFAALLGLLPAAIASSKGHNFAQWWLYGWLLFIFALPHAILLPADPRVQERVKLAADGKRCPYCAEVIKQEAVVCRFCGRDLPDTVEPTVKTAIPAGNYDSCPECGKTNPRGRNRCQWCHRAYVPS